MVFNATFNNISVTFISWRSVLLEEETGGPEENHWPVASNWVGFELTTSVAIGNDGIGSCTSNYHTITTTTPLNEPNELFFIYIMVDRLLLNPATSISDIFSSIQRNDDVHFVLDKLALLDL